MAAKAIQIHHYRMQTVVNEEYLYLTSSRLLRDSQMTDFLNNLKIKSSNQIKWSLFFNNVPSPTIFGPML